MTLASVYGSRPDRLPAGMVRLARTRESGARWVPREGVKLLTLAEHLRVERDSVGRFSRRSDGTVDWAVHPECVVRSSTAEPDAFVSEATTLLGTVRSAVVSWGGALALPSVRVSSHVMPELLPDVVSAVAEVTVWCEDVRLLLEYAYLHDSVVLAEVPSADR